MARRIKLQQTGHTRVRVSDLAKELGRPAAELLQFLQSEGEYVPAARSVIEEPVARLVRLRFGGAEQDQPQSSATPKGRPTNTALGPPARKHTQQNNPFKGSLAAFTEQPTIGMPEGAPAPKSLIHRTETPRSGAGDYSAAGVSQPSDTMKHLDWKVRGISDTERDVWLAHGLSGRDAWIAAQCMAAGLLPRNLSEDLQGFTVLYRVTHGEAADQVARLRREYGVAN